MLFSSLRIRLLHDVYSLLADLIDWADQFLLLKAPINPDDKYKKIAHDLTQAIKVSSDEISMHDMNTFLAELHLIRK